MDAFIDRIVDYITSYIDFAVDAVRSFKLIVLLATSMICSLQIKTEVGRCEPFTAAYTGLHITFCSKTLDELVSTPHSLASGLVHACMLTMEGSLGFNMHFRCASAILLYSNLSESVVVTKGLLF